LKPVANPILVEGCRVWDELTDKLEKTETPELYPFYMESDYEPLNCKIIGNHAEVIVGSSPGHKTHIDLTEGTVNYYDNDRTVNKAMYEILHKEIGLPCTIAPLQGVFCKKLTSDKVKDVFKAISLATSMDIRLESCVRLSDFPYDQATRKCKEREIQFYKTQVAPV